jgi:hypothetical protein
MNHLLAGLSLIGNSCVYSCSVFTSMFKSDRMVSLPDMFPIRSLPVLSRADNSLSLAPSPRFLLSIALARFLLFERV